MNNNFCQRCGTQLESNLKYCPGCGAQIGGDNTQQVQVDNQGFAMPQQQPQQMNYNQQPGIQQNTNDNGEKVLSIFGYLVGLVALIMYFVKPKTQAGKFHITQAFNLYIINFVFTIGMSIITSVINGIASAANSTVLSLLSLPFSLIEFAGSIFLFVLAIMGAVYAGQGQMKELPLIGKIKIVK